MRKILRGAKIIDCVNLDPLEGYEVIIERSIQKWGKYFSR